MTDHAKGIAEWYENRAREVRILERELFTAICEIPADEREIKRIRERLEQLRDTGD